MDVHGHVSSNIFHGHAIPHSILSADPRQRRWGLYPTANARGPSFGKAARGLGLGLVQPKERPTLCAKCRTTIRTTKLVSAWFTSPLGIVESPRLEPVQVRMRQVAEDDHMHSPGPRPRTKVSIHLN